MKTLFLDLETIPCQAPGAREKIREELSPPANYKNAETIAAWKDEKAEEAYLKTALDGTLGEIACIAWAIDDGPVHSLDRGLFESESAMLERFFKILVGEGLQLAPLYVGHNILGFDLRFIFHRCVINRVPIPFRLHHDTRYNGDHVYDTMLAWAGWNKYISISKICEALGISVKSDGIDGGDVWGLYQNGEHSRIAAYCREDVSAVRDVYYRMTFSDLALSDQKLDLAA